MSSKLESRTPCGIMVLASYVTELIFRVPRLMQLGESLEGQFETGYGGKGFNIAIAAHLAGAQVNVLMKVGRDQYGEEAIRILQSLDMSTDLVQRETSVSSGTGVVILLPSGDNAIALDPGANRRLFPRDVVVAEPIIAQSRLLVAPLELPIDTVRYAFAFAHASGTMTVLNPAPAQSLDPELLRTVDVIVPNETEASALTGLRLDREEDIKVVADTLLSMGVGAVAITLGGRGAFFATKEEHGFIVAPKVPVVDTTGAGDAFTGCLAVALAEGLDLQSSVRFATRAAALKVMRRGSSCAMPSRKEIEAFREG